MPRFPRIHAPGAMYHVTLRGNHRQDIFFAPGDRSLLTTIIREILDRCRAQIHAYCYMTNHVHALVQVADTPLSKIMLLVAGRYARAVQARLETTGHLFEKRYHALVVDTDEYLLTLLRYIHLNPVRAGLARSADEYPWTSHHAYLGRGGQPWVATAFAWSMFDADRSRAIAAYRTFMDTAADETSPLQVNPSDPRILGGESFARKLLGEKWRPQRGLGQVVETACAKFHVTAAELQSSSRLGPVVSARAWIADRATSERVASLAAVARYFNRDTSSIRQAMQRRRSRK